MTHDPHCPVTFLAGYESCPICDLLTAARNDERVIYQQTWKANLPRIEARNWLDGYRAAVNRRSIPDWVQQGSVPLRRGID